MLRSVIVLLCVLTTSAEPDTAWNQIQQNVFTRWCNEQLMPVNLYIHNLETDFSDGLKLLALLQVLSGKRINRYNKKPNFRPQKLENIAIALKFMEDEGFKLANIDASDILKGNLKLILGLTWTIILKYHLPPAGYNEDGVALTPKQKLMGWVKSKLPAEVNMKNFNMDWNDGIALGSLVESVAPGLFPEWEELDEKNGVDNARKAMMLAQDSLGIPMVITPEEIANPMVDELSVMTYVAYFFDGKLKPGAPLKFNAALQDAEDQGATHAHVQGFKVASVVLPATMMVGMLVVGVPLLAFVTRSSLLRRGVHDSAREHVELGLAE